MLISLLSVGLMWKTPLGWIQIGESCTRGVARILLGLKSLRDSRATCQQYSLIWVQPRRVFHYRKKSSTSWYNSALLKQTISCIKVFLKPMNPSTMLRLQRLPSKVNISGVLKKIYIPASMKLKLHLGFRFIACIGAIEPHLYNYILMELLLTHRWNDVNQWYAVIHVYKYRHTDPFRCIVSVGWICNPYSFFTQNAPIL